MRDSGTKHHIDKVVQECRGFQFGSFTSLYWLPWTILRSLVFKLFSALWPQTATRLLASCHLQQAEHVLVKLVDGRKRLCHIHCLSLSSVPQSLQNTLERDGGAYEGQEQLRVFQLFKQKYLYSPKQQTFKPLDAMPAHLPRQISSAFDDLRLIHTAGQSWADFNSAQVLTRRNMLAMYGAKRKLFRRDRVWSVLRHIYVELFIVQYVEIAYLLFRGYYWLPGLLAALTTAAAVSLILVVRQQHLKMMTLVNQRRLTPIVKGGWVRAVSSHKLVPGDVIVVQRGKAMCDMVLLQGSCLVVESMLSGEAAQVRKSAFVPDWDAYNPDKHQSNTVYAGTNVQQVWNAVDPEDEVLAMVCRTGLNTQVGSMVRQLASPSRLAHQKDPFIRDVFTLYTFAFGLQLILLIFRLSRVTRAHHSRGEIVIWVVDMFVRAAPPSIPTIFLVLTHIARTRLDRAGLSLLFSKALRTGANINMVCFDKTGTLTDSVAALHGVLPVHKGQFETLQQNAMRWDNRLRQAMAVCNGLVLINKTVVGMDLERNMFKAVEARFLDRDIIVLPRKPNHFSDVRTAKLTVLRTLEFSSQTLRSGVVVMADDSLAGTALLFIRGAPGPVKDLVQPSSVPDNFDEVRDDFSSNSFRMMAMAVGVIEHAHQLDLLHMTQQQIEAHVVHMDLLCLMVLTNSIRPDSEDTISQLQHGGGIRTMMITGDYHHTAIAVARDVGMVSSAAEMVIIDIARQNHTQQNSDAPSPQGVEGQGLIGDGGQGQAGLFPEASEDEGGHTMEGQLSIAQTILGHHPSWVISPNEEEEPPGLKLGSENALTNGVSQKQLAGQKQLASAQVAPSALPYAEATQEAASQSGKLSHRQSILKARHVLSTGRSHKKVVLPPLAAAPVTNSFVPSGRSDVSNDALLCSSMSRDSLGRAPDLTPAVQGGRTPHDARRLSFQGGSPTPPRGQHSNTQQTFDDHLEVQQSIAPALRSVGHHHRPPPLLIPSAHPQQSPATVTDAGHQQQFTSNPPAMHGSLSSSGRQEEQGGLAAADPSQIFSPSQQSMQHDTVPSNGTNTSWQRFARHSSLGMNPFLGLFTPTGFGCNGQGLAPSQGPPAPSKPGLAGLRFLQVQGYQECEGSWALSALAEGELQCAVTGDALEHMLQLQETSLLEAVMRNAVVFARMKPHQKGQVMALLGTAGLHQLFDGQHRHIEGLGNTTLFCGDGINDLAALSAADVGMAVGATDAIVAASLSTHRGSVAGVCSFIKAGKASHSLTASLFKYTMLYQWVSSLASATAFFVNGSSLAGAQIVGIDVQAIALALTACFVPALKQMNRHKPGPISTGPTFILLGSMASLAILVQAINMIVLHRQSWFAGGTGLPEQNPVSTMAWLVANFELLGPLISLVVDTRRFCEPALRFKPILLLTLLFLCLSYTAALGRPAVWGNLFMQYEFPSHLKVLFAWSMALEATSYGIICHTLRLVLQRYQRSRVAPA